MEFIWWTEAPSFTIKPNDVYQRGVNTEVKMPCDGVGQPKPIIYWRKVSLADTLYMLLLYVFIIIFNGHLDLVVKTKVWWTNGFLIKNSLI